MIDDTLEIVARELNREGVMWAVGASLLLRCHGLAASPRDIDIVVAERDAGKTAAILDRLGARTPGVPQGPYATARFLEYVVDGTSIDVMSGLGIRHDAGVYVYPFDELAIVGSFMAGQAAVPLTALEDWYVLYQLMPDREPRVRAIEEYLTKAGSTHLDLVERALRQPLPEDVKERTSRLLLAVAWNSMME